ncbi:MAG: PIN domain-containing protein [Actinobacteria bacterium]|nr:PIN domain-containing protein [Actinomycetota bacterium]MCI0678064.1 PIN domain-containing protein [Actinomycetota bacterium]
MALAPYYLGDTSALARLTPSEVAHRLGPLLEAGLLARCTPADLEAGFASTSPSSHRAMRQTRSAWPFVAMDQSVLDRAVEVQDALAERSQQRGVKIADLLIAAAAEAAGLVVLHYDHDFDHIAEITGQATDEWILPAGTVP